jgi:hypothetical protein
VPRRTNTFQKLVAILERHASSDADVQESAMLVPIRGGSPREVDVVVTQEVGRHKVAHRR